MYLGKVTAQGELIEEPVELVFINERDWYTVDREGVAAQDESIVESVDLVKWHSPEVMNLNTTLLFDKIVQEINAVCEEKNVKFDSVVVSMPGTMKDNSELVTSSRLDITSLPTPFPVSSFISEKLGGIPVRIINDVECMLLEAQTSLIATATQHETIYYIIVDEGVGAAITIDRKRYHGAAGVAGRISRLVVEKRGHFYHKFAQSGLLEYYASRPWISQHCVEGYEFDCQTQNTTPSKTTKFKELLQRQYENNDQRGLTFEELSVGVNDKDRIALTCFNEAAEYLGIALSYIITIINPHKIFLAGRLITDIDNFYDDVLKSAKKMTWPKAWDEKIFTKRPNARDDQVRGALRFAMIEK